MILRIAVPCRIPLKDSLTQTDGPSKERQEREEWLMQDSILDPIASSHTSEAEHLVCMPTSGTQRCCRRLPR